MLYERIVLCDDDCDEALFFELLLRELPPVDFQYFGESPSFLAYLEDPHNKPDIIFLDINIPKANGIQCLRIIRGMAHLHDVPVIIHSTNVTTEMVYMALENGASLYFGKAISFQHFKERFQYILSLRKEDLLNKVGVFSPLL